MKKVMIITFDHNIPHNLLKDQNFTVFFEPTCIM